MLTEEEKQRIRHEEIFRQEVRHEIARPTRWHHTWEILNCSFCLWAMSTVVLGVATWVFSKLSEVAEERRETTRALAHLDIELKFRLIALRDRLRAIGPEIEKAREAHGSTGETELMDELKQMFSELEHPPSSAFPEFKDRGLASLLIQLSSLRVDGGEDTTRLRGRPELIALRRIRVAFANMEANPTPEHLKSGVARILAELTQGALKHWANPPDLQEVTEPQEAKND